MTRSDLRKQWLPITSVISIIMVLVPAAVLWATDRAELHAGTEANERQDESMEQDVKPRLRMLEQTSAAQAENSKAMLRILESIDRRLERLEGRP